MGRGFHVLDRATSVEGVVHAVAGIRARPADLFLPWSEMFLPVPTHRFRRSEILA